MKNIQYILTISLALLLTSGCINQARAGIAYQQSLSAPMFACNYNAKRGDDKGDAYEDSVEAVEETIYIKENTESQK